MTNNKPVLFQAFFLTLLICYGLALGLFSLAGFPDGMRTGEIFPYLVDKPVGEDGFYMLTVAWNIAEGNGISYNYQQTTTGVQPLSTMIDAGLAWMIQKAGGDKWGLVRAVQILGLFYLVTFAFLARRLVLRLIPDDQEIQATAQMLALFLALFHYSLFRIFTYGLETGLYLILISLNVLISDQVINTEKKNLKLFIWGILAGLAILARLDFIVILASFLILSILRKQLTLISAGIVFLLAGLVASPWFIFVYQNSGNFLPSSGYAQSGLFTISQGLDRIWEMFRSIISHTVPVIYSRPNSILSLTAAIALTMFLMIYFHKSRSRSYIKNIFVSRPFFTNWSWALLILIPVYMIGFNATHFYTRYTAPIQVVLIPLLSVILADWSRGKSVRWRQAIVWGLPICFFAWAAVTLHTGIVTNSQAVSAGFVARHFPEPTRVGAFQSGVVGYFSPNVFNLDGKVNQDALVAQQHDRLAEYLDEERIEVLVDWPEIIRNKLRAPYLMTVWKPCEASSPDNRTICLVRKLP